MRLNLSDREARMSGLQDIKEFLEKQKMAVAGVRAVRINRDRSSSANFRPEPYYRSRSAVPASVLLHDAFF